jgi:hypothetical protein
MRALGRWVDYSTSGLVAAGGALEGRGLGCGVLIFNRSKIG